MEFLFRFLLSFCSLLFFVVFPGIIGEDAGPHCKYATQQTQGLFMGSERAEMGSVLHDTMLLQTILHGWGLGERSISKTWTMPERFALKGSISVLCLTQFFL